MCDLTKQFWCKMLCEVRDKFQKHKFFFTHLENFSVTNNYNCHYNKNKSKNIETVLQVHL